MDNVACMIYYTQVILKYKSLVTINYNNLLESSKRPVGRLELYTKKLDRSI